MKNLKFTTCAILLLSPVIMWAIVLGGRAPIWRPDFGEGKTANIQKEEGLRNSDEWKKVIRKIVLAGNGFVSFFPEKQKRTLLIPGDY